MLLKVPLNALQTVFLTGMGTTTYLLAHVAQGFCVRALLTSTSK